MRRVYQRLVLVYQKLVIVQWKRNRIHVLGVFLHLFVCVCVSKQCKLPDPLLPACM